MSYLRRVVITVRRVKTHFANIHLYLLAARSNENVWKITKRRENENTDHWVTAPLIPQSGRRRLWVLAYAPLSGEQKWCVFEVKGGRGVKGFRGGRKGGMNTAIPHMVGLEYRNTASKFSQIPKPLLQMGKSWCCQYYKSSFQIEIILLCQCFQIKVRRSQACDKHKIIALV